MFKDKKIISTFLILFIILQPFKAAAEPKMDSTETLTKFTVNADTTEIGEFDGTIYVYIYDSKNKINIFGLNKKNNFTSTYELPVGEATLNRVIVKNNDGTELRVKYSSEGNLITTENDKEHNFTIKIQKGFEEDNNKAEENNNDEVIEETEKIEENKEDEEKIKKEEMAEKEKSREKRRIINLIMDVILIIFFSILLAYAKYRDKKREKESGEK